MKLNVIDLPKDDYKGGASTLCPGCGHDQISNVIINAAWENGVHPEKLAKMSGIGCSSKTPAYFLGQSHGFNTVHGRMPTVTTGAAMGNRDLTFLAVSGDGDSASIGIGHFIHAVRRNLDMVYVLENNGVYGLTKGQYSATAVKGSKKKKAQEERAEVVGEGKGLYANIHAKRKRGEKMRSKGDKGAPTEKDFKDSAKTAKKESLSFSAFRSISEKK